MAMQPCVTLLRQLLVLACAYEVLLQEAVVNLVSFSVQNVSFSSFLLHC